MLNNPFSASQIEVDDPDFESVWQSGCSVFQTKRVVKAVEEHLFKQGESLVIIGVRDAIGVPVALFPFLKTGVLGSTVLEGLDADVCDYFAPPLLDGVELNSQQTRQMWEAVCSSCSGVDVIKFKKVPKTFLRKRHALSAFPQLCEMGVSASHVRLSSHDGADRFVSIAREVRRKAKKLERYGCLSFSPVGPYQDRLKAFEVLRDFRQKRFRTLGRSDLLASDDAAEFYQDLLTTDEASPGKIFTLHSGDVPIAVIYALQHQKEVTFVIPAISNDPDVQHGSPGLVAIFYLLEWCRKHDMELLDLSVGDLSYKKRFSAETSLLYEYVEALSAKGALIAAEVAARRRMRHLSQRLPWIRRLAEKAGLA